MTDLQAIADRVEIEALRGEFTDALDKPPRSVFAAGFSGLALARRRRRG